MILFTKILIHVSTSRALAPPTCKMRRYVYACTFLAVCWLKKIRYCCIPWIKLSSMHPFTSISTRLDLPPYWILWKSFKKASQATKCVQPSPFFLFAKKNILLCQVIPCTMFMSFSLIRPPYWIFWKCWKNLHRLHSLSNLPQKRNIE